MNPYHRVLLSFSSLTMSLLLCGVATSQGIHKLWGGAYAGGATNNGTVFNVQYDGRSPVLGASLSDIGMMRPVGSLVFHNQKLYGLCRYGGPSDNGSLFEFDPYTKALVKKLDFDGTSGGQPELGPVLYNNVIYGVTRYGGASNVGVLFSFDPATGTYTKRKDMVLATGGEPASELVVAGSLLYGTAASGGLHNSGVLFSFDPATNTYQQRAHFDGSNGMAPCGNLVYYNHKIYGTAVYAGAFGKGTLWEFDPATGILKVLQQLSDPAHPQNGLIAYNGVLYGVTKKGGSDNNGTFFAYNLTTGVFSKFIDFAGTWGVYPTGTVEYNGKIYILTNDLGALSSGTVVEYDPVSGAYAKKADLDYGVTGAHPSFVNLTKVQSPTAPAATGTCTDMPVITITAANANQWVAITDAAGNAVAEINANGNVLGIVRTTVYIHSGAPREDLVHNMYLDRNLTITPQFTPTSAVNLRLYIRGGEYDKLRTAVSSVGLPAGITSVSDIGVYRNNTPCSPLLAADAPSVPNTGLTWAKEDYVLSTAVTELSSFYFSSKMFMLLNTYFTGFDAVGRNGRVLLQWSALEDEASYQYAIERSADMRTFTQIGVANAVNKQGKQFYTWYDEQPLITGYYRVRMLKLQGAGTVTAIRKVVMNASNLEAVVYDDAAGAAIRVGVVSPERQSVVMHVYTATGQLVLRNELTLQPGRQTHRLSGASLARGTYYLLVGNERYQQRVGFVRK